jgi:hypothetical protein
VFDNRVLRDLRGMKFQEAGKNCIGLIWISINCNIHQYYADDQIMDDEIAGLVGHMG